MIQVGIVYFTKTDITGKLVDSAALGIESTGASVFLHSISGSEIIDGRFVNENVFKSLEICDAIIFASPTYMGGVAAQFKAFADATSAVWGNQGWAGKLAAGITSGSALNGDQTSTLQYFSTLASQQGMYWVGIDAVYQTHDTPRDRLGCQLGVVAQSSNGKVHKTDLETAKYLGIRVSSLALKLND